MEMNKGMPRLIEDERRKWFQIGISLAVLLIVCGLFIHSAWMKQFRENREKLREWIKEGSMVVAATESRTGIERRIADAGKMLSEVYKCNPAEQFAFRDLEIRPEFYVQDDILAAKRIIADFNAAKSKRDMAAKVLERAKQDALTVTGAVFAAKPEIATGAIDALKACIGELAALESEARPNRKSCDGAGERFFAVLADARDARAELSHWSENTEKAISDVKRIQSAANEALAAMKAAKTQAEALRAKASEFRVDRNCPVLENLSSDLGHAVEAASAVRKAGRDAMSSLSDDMRRIVENATEQCTKAAASIGKLQELHGSLIPSGVIENAKKANEDLGNAIQAGDREWTRICAELKKAMDRSEKLETEAVDAAAKLDRYRQNGTGSPGMERANELISDLGMEKREMEAVIAKMSVDSLNKAANRCLSMTSLALSEANELVRSIPKRLESAKLDAMSLSAELQTSEDNRKQALRNLSNFSGTAADRHREILSNLKQSDAMKDEVSRLMKATAENGIELAEVTSRLEKAKSSVRKFVDDIEAAMDSANRDVADGTLIRTMWNRGVCGRAESGNQWVPTGALVAENGTATFEWEFYVDVDVPDNRTVSVEMRRLNQSGAVNGAISRSDDKSAPIPVLSRSQTTRKFKGGTVKVLGELVANGQSFKGSSPVPNYLFNWSPKGYVVVSGTPNLDAGRNQFRFKMHLASDPFTSEPEWHAERLEFRVCLDGIPVSEYWYKVAQ